MKIRRISAGIALVAAGALALSACSNSPSTGESAAPSASAASGGTVTVAEVNGFSSFNSSTGTGNSDINSKVALVTGSHFYYIDGDLKVQHDKSFGTEEVVSQDPLTVKYTINKGKTWSDGEPITADDLMLAWAVFSGHYNDKATTYFDYAGDTTGLGLTDLPVIGDDNESITMTYSQPFADWETAFDLDKPAHILAKKAGLADAAALTKLFQDTPKGDPTAEGTPNAELQKVADFYNTGWDTTTMPTDPDLVVSSGPWIVKDIVDGQSITLGHNPKYSGDQKPKIDELVIRTIGDAQSMVQALQNGEVDVVAPQASADTLSALSALQGVTVQQGNQLSYDHLDLNFSGVFADPKVRQAFMKTVPRQAILDAIITPLDPKAKPLDSQLFVPQQDAYADVIKTNTSADYAKPDIAGAKALLAGATPTVRLMYNKDNPNRVDAYTLIAASAKEAGFNIVDGGLPKTEWSAALGNGTYDATIFGWINSGVGVSGVPQIFKTGAGNNFNGFSDPDADALMDKLVVTTDAAKQIDIEKQIDPLIWKAFYGLPLFQSVGVAAISDRVQGLGDYNPNQNGVFWNVWKWTVSS